MVIGDSFLTRSLPSFPKRLWVIVSDPNRDPDSILCVMISDLEIGRDDSCILSPGEHSAISGEMAADYSRAKTVSIDVLRDLEVSGQIIPREPFSDEALRRIQEGLLKSPFAKRGHKRLLRIQGLPS